MWKHIIIIIINYYGYYQNVDPNLKQKQKNNIKTYIIDVVQSTTDRGVYVAHHASERCHTITDF